MYIMSHCIFVTHCRKSDETIIFRSIVINEYYVLLKPNITDPYVFLLNNSHVLKLVSKV